ncbi:MAG: (2Fe-2S)-binding protein, partial [Paracoccaceae bacterium]
LGASDLAIVEFRRLMVDAAQLVAEGGPAIGANPDIVQTNIASYEGVVSKDVDWRDLVGANTQNAAE